MGNSKISALSNAAALTGAEEVHGTQGGASVAVSAAQISEYVARLMHPGYVSGRWYGAFEAATGAASAISNTLLRMVPFRIWHPVTITSLGCRLTGGSAATNAQIAIYAHDAALGRATGNPVASTGNIATTGAAGGISAVITQTSVTLQPGIYWIGVICSSTSPTFACANAASMYLGAALTGASGPEIGCPEGSFANYRNSYTMTYGTWPDLTSVAASISASSGGIAFASFLVA